MFNRIYNGDFLIAGKEHEDFPEGWQKICGNKATTWKFKQELRERPFVEIHNLADIRAGIIQTREVPLDVGQEEHWLIILLLKSDRPEVRAYLRCYPMMSDGNVAEPWIFNLSLGKTLEKYRQVISAGSDIRAIRFETGIVGPGCLYINQLIAYPIRPALMQRRVKTIPNKPRQIGHIQSIGEITKPIQLAMPIPLKVPVTVQALVDAEVRNLTPTRDKVQIFGSSLLPLATTNSGRAQVEISGHEFHESIEEVKANQTSASTTTRDVAALPRFSFAIYNFGSVPAHVQAELSPDGVLWAKEGPQLEVGPGNLIIVSPKNFLRYTRLAYWAENLTTLKIWVQAQS
jgi:hypothetical protein